MLTPIKIQAQKTRVYDRNATSGAKYLVNVGGARSSKSHSIAQLLIRNLLNIPNRKILISRKTFPALRLTAYRLIIDLLSDYRAYGRLVHNKSEHTITNPANGAFIAFLSIDDPEKIKSTEWNDIWLEEANEFTWEDWLVIQTRLSARTTPQYPNKIYLSLNPSDEQGWINQRLMLVEHFAKNLEVIHSSYRDNPFLGKEYIEILQSLKDQDENAWRVFSEGEWGTISHVIYKQYEMLPVFPAHIGEIIYGIDFGFNNPSAVIKVGVKDLNSVYLNQLVYKTHLTNSQLIDEIKTLVDPNELKKPWYADCAEPDRIAEFAAAGFNIYEADKEVVTGIDFCKRKKYHTLASNIDLNKERAVYKWRQDKNGNVLDEPVKFMDHLMDAKRYALYTHFKSFIPPVWVRKESTGMTPRPKWL